LNAIANQHSSRFAIEQNSHTSISFTTSSIKMQATPEAPPPTMSTVLLHLQQISHFTRLCYNELHASPSTYFQRCHNNHSDHIVFANDLVLDNSKLIGELDEYKSSFGNLLELLKVQDGELKKMQDTVKDTKKMRDAVQDAEDRNAELIQARDKELNEHNIATEAMLELVASSDQKVAELEGRVQELQQEPQYSRPPSSRKRKQPTKLGLEYKPLDGNGAEGKRVRAE
jgi:hypothetical protein